MLRQRKLLRCSAGRSLRAISSHYHFRCCDCSCNILDILAVAEHGSRSVPRNSRKPKSEAAAAPRHALPPDARRAPCRKRGSDDHRALREEIISLTRKPGEPIVEKDIAQAQSVSRTPVREALLRLAAEGLVDTVAKSGTFVARIPISALPEAIVVRKALEQVTARAAATQARRSQITNLKAHSRATEGGRARRRPGSVPSCRRSVSRRRRGHCRLSGHMVAGSGRQNANRPLPAAHPSAAGTDGASDPRARYGRRRDRASRRRSGRGRDGRASRWLADQHGRHPANEPRFFL